MAVLALLAIAPNAHAAALVGITERHAPYIGMLRWKELKVRHVRGIFPWNVAQVPKSRARLEKWLTAVKRARRGEPRPHSEPFVVLEHSGENTIPSVRRYKPAFDLFFEQYGPHSSWGVKVIGPWNEPNFSRHKVKRASTAAGYYKHAADVVKRANCRDCTLVAGEFAGNTSGPNMSYVTRYLRLLKNWAPQYAGVPTYGKYVGVHTYGDVQRFQVCKKSRAFLRTLRQFDIGRSCRPSGRGTAAREIDAFNRAVRAQLPDAEMWLTETGAFKDWIRKTRRRRKPPFRERVTFTERTQCQGSAFIQSLPARYPRITRIYYYRFSDQKQEGGGEEDTGLLARPGEATFAPPRPGETTPPRQAFYNIKHRDAVCVPRRSMSAFTSSVAWVARHGDGSTDQLMADVNGDGKADAVVYYHDSGSWHVALSNGRTFDPPAEEAWISGHGIGSDKRMLGDVTGDGLADAVVFFHQGGDETGSWYVSPSTGSAFAPWSKWTGDHGSGADKVSLSDVNGDGTSDAVAFFGGDGSWRVALSTGTSFAAPSEWIAGHGIGSSDQALDDVTGDDVPDAVVFFNGGENPGSWYVAPSTESAFAPWTQWTSGYGAGSDQQTLDDVDGDNLADAVVFVKEQGSWFVAPSTGTSFRAGVQWRGNFGSDATTVFVADVNGDDAGDAVTFEDATGRWNAALAGP